MLRIMTQNVWNRDENNPAWAEKGNDCSAAVRVKGHMRIYEDTKPDIIGGQEFSRLMAELMKGEFSTAACFAKHDYKTLLQKLVEKDGSAALEYEV